MSTESPGFFSDPKVLLSLFALLTSILSLFWTLANQWEQTRRWDALNAGSVELKEAKFYTWRELTRDESVSTNWGYDPLIFGSSDGWNKFRLVYFLQPCDQATGAPISNANPVFTLPELEAELKRLRIQQQIEVYKAFRPTFIFDNMGKTEVIDCKIFVEMRLENVWRHAFNSNIPIRIPAGTTVNISFDFAIPISQVLPKQIDFKIHIDFMDIHGKHHSREVVASWESTRDYWFYGNSSA
ncbi:MAG: hypothetical protein HQK59_07420 [Deltaproteobacteria bacterium]|nr:hypothetical protein [Deltaproteobacteria bacterium]